MGFGSFYLGYYNDKRLNLSDGIWGPLLPQCLTDWPDV